MKPALAFLLATIVFANAGPSDIASLQQSVANLTNLVNQILSKTAQSLDTETTSTSIVIAQLALMQQLVSIGYINTKGCPTKCSLPTHGNNDKKAIKELGEKIFTKLDNIASHLDDKVDHKQLDMKIKHLTDKIDRLLKVNNESDIYDPSSLLHSCEEIKTNWPDSPSDYYIIADNNGHPRHVYCHMESLCNSSEGWMRVAYLNMSDPTEECPPGFRLHNQKGIRACGMTIASSVHYCQSVKFPSYNIRYSQVCGKVIGYHQGTPDALQPRKGSNDINAAYVDGVSLTHGNPRQHIWTFMAGLQENSVYSNGIFDCPCAPNSPITVPDFIGNDYFCESGNPGHWEYGVFYTDSLWDGKQCGLIEKVCCQAPDLPWFHKLLKVPTSDYIELRICASYGTEDHEDTPLGFYEIYVK